MRGDVPPLSVSPQNKQGNVCLGHETGMPWSPGDVRFTLAKINLVPLFHLKFQEKFCRKRCRNFKRAAPGF
jgi:hypothetical protein